MTLAMPRTGVHLPSVLNGQQNGAVNPALLATVEPGRTGLIWLMVELPARGMRALHAKAAKAGIILTSEGRGRTLDQQWTIFGGSQARYRPCTYNEWVVANPLGHGKSWPDAERHAVAATLAITIPNSVYWCMIQFPNGSWPAMAGVPGTSNHGWWCADDLAEIINGQVVSLRPSTVQWLYANAPACGFTWEAASEEWHVSWAFGDVVPQAVLDYEASIASPQPVQPVPPSSEDDEMTSATLWRDTRFANVFLVNGDVCTVDDHTYESLTSRGVPVVTNEHDQMLIGCMRKAKLTIAQMVPTGVVSKPFTPPADLS